MSEVLVLLKNFGESVHWDIVYFSVIISVFMILVEAVVCGVANYVKKKVMRDEEAGLLIELSSSIAELERTVARESRQSLTTNEKLKQTAVVITDTVMSMDRLMFMFESLMSSLTRLIEKQQNQDVSQNDSAHICTPERFQPLEGYEQRTEEISKFQYEMLPNPPICSEDGLPVESYHNNDFLLEKEPIPSVEDDFRYMADKANIFYTNSFSSDAHEINNAFLHEHHTFEPKYAQSVEINSISRIHSNERNLPHQQDPLEKRNYEDMIFMPYPPEVNYSSNPVDNKSMIEGRTTMMTNDQREKKTLSSHSIDNYEEGTRVKNSFDLTKQASDERFSPFQGLQYEQQKMTASRKSTQNFPFIDTHGQTASTVSIKASIAALAGSGLTSAKATAPPPPLARTTAVAPSVFQKQEQD